MKSVIAFGVALGAAVLVGQSVETQLLQKNALSLEAPRKMVRAVEAEAERNYWHGAAAVVDDGGWHSARTHQPRRNDRFGRADDALPHHQQVHIDFCSVMPKECRHSGKNE